MPSFQPVVFVISVLAMVLAAAMVLPALADLAVGNPDWIVFAISASATAALAGMGILSSSSGALSLGVRQAFMLTTFSWAVLSAFAALPLYFSELELSYTDAYFEAISGLTTTGSTVLTGLDAMAPGLLLWRSLLQWMGGVGIIVLGIAILPFLRVGGMQLFYTESSDRSDKIMPQPGQIARAIGLIYLVLTFLCALSYGLAGMSGFDAVAHAMTTVATGGYSTSDNSLGNWSSAVQWVSVLFMLAGAIPFLLYARVFQGRPKRMFRDSQVRSLLGFLTAVILTLTVWLWLSGGGSFLDSLRLVAFNVVSVVTTTGYATTDYGLWGSFAVGTFFFLTFVGGCAGSTSGGIKVFRFEILYRMTRQMMRRLVYPNGVFPQSYAGRPLTEEVTTSVIAFFTLFAGTVVLLALALGLMGLDFITALSSAATAVANVGPGLGEIVGPAGNFATLPDAGKWLLAFGMLMGRLEMFTVMVLLLPNFWRG